MKALLYYDTSTKALTDGSSAWTPPTFTFGESLALSLRFQETVGGAQSESFPAVQYLKAAIGNVDARPASGTFRVKIGEEAQTDANTTVALTWNAGALELQNALNALTAITTLYGTAKVFTLAGSYLITFGIGATLVPISLVESQLHPPCFGQVNSWQSAGAWTSELRLIQAPAAITDSSERVLPAAPTVTRIQAGWTDGEFKGNEIQQMTMPPEFRGTYQFRRNNIRTVLLSSSDGPDQVAAALAIYGNTITVTNPRENICRIEFGGTDFAGIAQPLLEIVVADAPVGDLTFTLDLTEPPLAAMLRPVESVTLPFEIEIGIADGANVEVHKIRLSVTVQRGVIYAMLAAAAGIDWLRPIPKDYIPFTTNQVITGQQFYACALGNGSAHVFTVDHNLNTENIAAILLRENADQGRILVIGTDYSVAYDNANSLTLTLLGSGSAPAAGALAVVITGAGPVAAFQAHTHTIDQIVGLPGALETIGTRLTTLEAYLPSTTPTLATATTGLTITIPPAAKVLFYDPATLDLTKLPTRAPFLLPAVHLSTLTGALPSPLPTPALNNVWSASARTLIPGTHRIEQSYVDAGGFVASDGRMLFPASQAGATVSYYPKPFERILFEFPINEQQLLVGKTLDVEFGLAAQLVNNDCEAQWVLVIDWGLPVDQTDPANEGLNLQTINWNATPLLLQRIFLTRLQMLHTFGVRIQRTSSAITADKMCYGGWSTAANAAPSAPNFLLRARLVEFDTKNNVPNATGWLWYALGKTDDIKSPITATIG